MAGFELTPAARADNFAFQYTGFIPVPADGTYTFSTTSDDGSQLFIGSALVVDNNGVQGPTEQLLPVALPPDTYHLRTTLDGQKQAFPLDVR